MSCKEADSVTLYVLFMCHWITQPWEKRGLSDQRQPLILFLAFYVNHVGGRFHNYFQFKSHFQSSITELYNKIILDWNHLKVMLSLRKCVNAVRLTSHTRKFIQSHPWNFTPPQHCLDPVIWTHPPLWNIWYIPRHVSIMKKSKIRSLFCFVFSYFWLILWY